MGNEGSKYGDTLNHALEDHTEADFKGQRNIPRGRLEDADRIDTKSLLVNFYDLDPAIAVTIRDFSKVSLMDPVARLRRKQQQLDFRRKYMKHIAERYRWIKDGNAPGEEVVHLQKRYTKLLIVQKHRYEQERQHEIMSYGEEHTGIMNSLANSKHYIHLDTLLDPMKDGTRPRTIVLQGPAGIGKTMTAKKIMLDWAQGELYKGLIDYVFYLSCREINEVKKHKSVIDVISTSCPEMTIPRSALEADPKKILFIVDGFDELKLSLDLKEDQHCSDLSQKNPVEVTLSNLLRRNILSQCTIIITTRPKALAQLNQCINISLCTEIIGFTEQDRMLYFNAFFDNDEHASRALAVVKDNDTLYTMCFLPIVCWIMCTVMKQQMDRGQDIMNSSKTTTSVYLFFLSTLLRDHSAASPPTMQRSLKKLCSLALNGIFEQRILFEDEDLEQFGLKMPDIQSLFLNQNIFQQDIDVYTAHSFIHLSFQEFFAALFYILDLDVGSLKSQRDLKHLLKEYSQHTKGHLMLTVRFLFGLIGKDQLRHVEEVLGCKISHSARDDLVAWIQEPKDKSLLLDVFHCLHETQDGDIISSTMNNIQNINIARSDYKMIDFKALSFCLKHCQGDKTLNMSDVHFGPKIQEIMKPALRKCSTLRLLGCYMWDEESSLDTWSSDEESLPETRSSDEESSPESRSSEYKRKTNTSVLCEEVRDPSCCLKKLNLSCCGITGASWADLAASLCTNRSLLELDLTLNKLGDDGASLLCDVLKEPDNRLQKINLVFCGITRASCADLAASLRTNRSLLDLDLGGNKLGDDGASLLCDVLKEPDNRLQKINLSDCGITGVSCADLAASLRTNRSLLELDLIGNKLGDDGASLLCDALKEPDNRLQKISLSDCGITSASCAVLAASLRTNCSLLELDLRGNPLGDNGASLLCDVLKEPENRLQKINLSRCGITDASYADLAASLRANQSLLELDLSYNELDDDGASLLCDVLKEPDNRLQKIKISWRLIDSAVLDELKRARPELEIRM